MLGEIRWYWLIPLLLLYIPYLVLARKILIRNVLLLITSYALLLSISMSGCILLFWTTVLHFCAGRSLPCLRPIYRKMLLWGVILQTIAIFVILRLEWATSPALFDWGLSALILPIGFSFYSFQALGYTFDVYRGKREPMRNFLTFALFIGFFPQIVSGPISRADEFVPQLTSAKRISGRSFSEGCFLIVWGLVKKIAIADTVGLIANALFSSPRASTIDPLIAGLAFTLQIYADFSGYTDMARGIALLLGFHLPLNFSLPYFSSSPQEFWKRWHISLSRWFKDYVYIPLGGNRVPRMRALLNLLLTMLLVGLWHGGTLMFIFWGLYHGCLLIAYHVSAPLLRRSRFMRKLSQTPLPNVLFFCLTIFGWMIFRSSTPQMLWSVLHTFGFGISSTHVIIDLGILWGMLLIMDVFQYWKCDLLAVAHASAFLQTSFYTLAFVSLLLLSSQYVAPFIYSRF